MSVAEYEGIEVESIKQVLGRRALVKWEEAPRTYGKTGVLAKLARPATHTKAYYTGVVLKAGLDLTDEIQEGDRIFFERFSGFAQFSDQKHGRVAIVEEPAIQAVIPPREDGAYPVVEDAGVYQ